MNKETEESFAPEEVNKPDSDVVDVACSEEYVRPAVVPSNDNWARNVPPRRPTHLRVQVHDPQPQYFNPILPMPIALSPVHRRGYDRGNIPDSELPILGPVPYTSTSSQVNYPDFPVVYSYGPPPPMQYMVVPAPSSMYQQIYRSDSLGPIVGSIVHPDEYVWSSPSQIPGHGRVFSPAPPPSMAPAAPPSMVDYISSPDNLCEMAAADITELRQVSGRVYAMSQDQTGCRVLQKLVHTCSQMELQLMYHEIQHVLFHVMTHFFGNYFFQRLFYRASLNLRFQIVSSVLQSLAAACAHVYGSRSVQSMICHISQSTELTDIFVQGILPYVQPLCMSKYGNHVIQRCLECFDANGKEPIIQALRSNFASLCTNQYGNAVFQKAIETSADMAPLSLDLANETVVLMQVRWYSSRNISLTSFVYHQDTYGNYVIQALLNRSPHLVEIVCEKCVNWVVHLSKQKFSSVVMESCIDVGECCLYSRVIWTNMLCTLRIKAPPSIQAQYVNEICHPSNIGGLVNHRYGNFVLQKALCSLQGQLKCQLVDALRPWAHLLDRSGWGRRIISHLEDKS